MKKIGHRCEDDSSPISRKLRKYVINMKKNNLPYQESLVCDGDKSEKEKIYQSYMAKMKKKNIGRIQRF